MSKKNAKKTYSVGDLSKLAGVSIRTLRYYDQVGLLSPVRTASGYREYGTAEVDRLQQILLYRELEVPIDEIGRLLGSAERGSSVQESKTTLCKQREQLVARKAQIDVLLKTIDKTLDALEGGAVMSDKQKFDGFVREKIEENEARYGAELRERYGDATMDASNEKLGSLNKEGFESLEAQGGAIYSALAEKFTAGAAVDAPEVQELIAQHYAFLQNYGDFYTKDVYKSLGEGYATDPRFVAFYDGFAKGLAGWFKDAIAVFCA